MVNGQVHNFRVYGLYNGLAVMIDDESESIWEHVTGECIRGENLGQQLATDSAQYMTVAQVLSNDLHAQIAISKPTIKSRILDLIFLKRMAQAKGYLPSLFHQSMTEGDMRLPDLEIGLGVWIDGQARFYPLQTIRDYGNAFVDSLNGQSILIYIDPVSYVPIAYRTDAQILGWEGDDLVLESGERIQNGHVLNAAFEKQMIERPEQQFTRWYGFSYMFPKCGIYAYEEYLI